MEKNEVIILEDRGFIQVNGVEAKDFLQNIVTNDLENVTNSSTVFSSILTPQGKYLFDFFILKFKDSYILECEKVSVVEIIKLLSFFLDKDSMTVVLNKIFELIISIIHVKSCFFIYFVAKFTTASTLILPNFVFNSLFSLKKIG